MLTFDGSMLRAHLLVLNLCSSKMVLFVISDVTVDIQFCPKLRPIIITAVIYLAIYLIFVIKGYYTNTKQVQIKLKPQELVGALAFFNLPCMHNMVAPSKRLGIKAIHSFCLFVFAFFFYGYSKQTSTSSFGSRHY